MNSVFLTLSDRRLAHSHSNKSERSLLTFFLKVFDFYGYTEDLCHQQNDEQQKILAHGAYH